MNDPYRTECRAVMELLVALLTEELEAERAAQLHRHLEQCAACQSELETLQQAQEQAAALRLESPVLDRYPEFLRRLAADESARSSQALVQLTEPAASVATDGAKLAEAATPASGLAAVIPLFGRRLMVRNGFGQGFELALVSAQGHELLRVASTSLTRVAAVAAGVSVFAGLSVLALLLFLFPHWFKPSTEPQAIRPASSATHQPDDNGPRHAWVQTFSNAQMTLALWPSGDQLLTSRITGNEATPPMPLRTWPNEPPLPPPAPLMVAGGTDGLSYVIVREQGQRLIAWHLATSAPPARPSPMPFHLAENALQPSLAWSGDRYLLAYVEPSLQTPVIKLLELGPGGRPIGTPALLAAETEDLDKVGRPSLIANGPRGALFFFTASGQLQGRPFVRDNGQLEFGERQTLARLQRSNHTPLLMLSTANGYLVCWGELDQQGAELRLARLDGQLRRQAVTTLASGEWPISAFDWRATTDGFVLLWKEARPAGSQLLKQTFHLDGSPLHPPEVIQSSLPRHAGISFSDLQGKALVWTEQQPDGTLGLARKALR
jgi:hypothetical protein